MPAPDDSGANPSVTVGPGARDNLRSSAVLGYVARTGRAKPIARPDRDRAENSDGRGLFFVVDQVAGLVRVHRDAGAHGGGDGGLLDVAGLGGGRLVPGDLGPGGRGVVPERP